MFNVLSHQGNKNSNCFEIPPHSQLEWLSTGEYTITKAGMNVEKEPILIGNMNLDGLYGNQGGSFSKLKTELPYDPDILPS